MGVVGEILQAHAPGKDLAHLAAIHMQRRDDDVRGLFLAQLQNDLGQIGLEDIDAVGFEKRIQLNLGRGHGLDLDDLIGVFLAQQVEQDAARLGGVGGPMHDAAGGGAVLFKLLQISAQIF